MRIPPVVLLLLLINAAAPAQVPALADSLGQKLSLLSQLVEAGNQEQATVEAQGLRDFLMRHRLLTPPRAVPLLSDIYRANRDERTALRFLAEAEVDARRERRLETRATLLQNLIAAYATWQAPDRALACQQLLSVAQDSLSARRQRAEVLLVQRELDSLRQALAQRNAVQTDRIVVDRYTAYGVGSGLALLIVLLISSNLRSAARWRKRLEKKELEFDVQRANLRHQHADSIQPITADPVPTTHAAPQAPPPPDPNGRIALLIEPNRQIVMYLKSLLSDRFHVETAQTPAEALQLAANLLPDLIVCDVVLNGKTGIEIARQLKLSERTSHIPIVLLTDRHGNEGKLDALRAGAESWFPRPVLDEEFDAQVRFLLDVHKMRHDDFARTLHLYFTASRPALPDPFLQRALQTAEEHLADPDFTAEDLARKLQFTKHQFSRKLRMLTGKEPTQLIREMRLEKAKILLEMRAGTPKAVADLVGFSNPGTFALAFKEYFGENTLLLQPPRIG